MLQYRGYIVATILTIAVFCGRLSGADVPVSAIEAAKKVGEKVTVEVQIQSGGRNSEYHELYSTKDRKDDGCFFLRFSAAARERFAEVNIPDVGANFMDETVRVTGEVQSINVGNFKRPVIYIEQVDQIELVSANREFTPTDRYQTKVIAGFTVLIGPEVVQQKKQANEATQFIEGQLKALNTSLPKDKLELLHKVRIWVEWESRKSAGAAFHPSGLWLKRNGLNPDKAGCIEIPNVRNYVQWSRDKRCSGILHEMSHALHVLHLGENNPKITTAFKQAMERKLYDSVPFVEGGRRQAYATTNEKEYFAEISEAYFGRNDFFPFNRDQLRSHDPAAEVVPAVVEKLAAG